MTLYKRLPVALITALTLSTLGCGGGGGNDDVVARAQGSGQATTTVGTTNPGTVTVPITQSKTFTFPTFSVNSRLAVVGNFQTSTETPNETGTLTTVLSDLGAIPRVAARVDPSAQESGSFENPCGFPDACAIDRLIGEPRAQQSTSSTAIRPRFQELAEGAEEDFFLVPAFKSVTGRKILQPNETVHCTIFAEVVGGNPVIDRSKALEIAQAFDSNNPQRPGSGIYDQARAVFGSEWNQNPTGGNDGDTKVVIFFFSSQTLGNGLFGYVSPADGNPNGGSSSNKGEILYINADKSTYQTLATISHEFQHLINQNQKINQQGLNPANAKDENVSVNEGLSGLSEEVCGYTLNSGNNLLLAVLNDYLEKPEQHEFFNFSRAGLGYGQGYLFFKYVREHFGDQTIRNICTDTGSGLANLNKHLPNGFPEIFRRWTIANYATNLSGNVPSIYKYPSGFRTDGTYPAGTLVGVKVNTMGNNATNPTNALRPWSCNYQILESEPGVGVQATVNPASGSPYGVIFESSKGQFTSLEQ
ncbi:MAG TPA: hypothetical protein EYO33_08740 [Phycisphaerales bacterium]|nr:hypothetical protein [Phycisphaerales bacterium]